MSSQQLYSEIMSLPKELQKEVALFVSFLKEKKQKVSQGKGKATRTSGLAKGLVKMSDDFDEPLEDFKEYM
jgi:hypothetical protein